MIRAWSFRKSTAGGEVGSQESQPEAGWEGTAVSFAFPFCPLPLISSPQFLCQQVDRSDAMPGSSKSLPSRTAGSAEWKRILKEISIRSH